MVPRAEAARGEAFADFYGQHAGRDAESGLGPGMVPRADAARGEAFADFYGDKHAGKDTESNFTVGTLPGMCGPAPVEESITSRLKIKPAPHAVQDGLPGPPRGRRDGTLTPKIGGGGLMSARSASGSGGSSGLISHISRSCLCLRFAYLTLRAHTSNSLRTSNLLTAFRLLTANLDPNRKN